jgi:hypothetical protein
LAKEKFNLRQLLDKNFVDSIINYTSLAHINPDQIGNVLERATNKLLLLTDVVDQNIPNVPKIDESLKKKSMWIPNDSLCPKVWYVSPIVKLPPSKQMQKGPFRISELFNEIEKGNVTKDQIAAPVTTEENDDEEFDTIVDTGRWKPISDYFQLRIQMLYPGKALYSPAEMSLKCLSLLQAVAAVHKSTTSKGTNSKLT